MRTIVVDLELTNPKKTSGSIIQIGAVCINLKSHKIESVFNKFCRPVNGELPDQFITELTGITVEQVEAADPLDQCLEQFWSWCQLQNSGMRLTVWGGGDIPALEKQSELLGIQVPRIKQNDLKMMAEIFRGCKKGEKLRGGLQNTLKLFGLSFYPDESFQHDALYDALNTALLACYFQQVIEFGIGIEASHGPIKMRRLAEMKKEYEDLKTNE